MTEADPRTENAGVPPLDGLRVLDMSMLTPGPFATQILADLGATVLKVERPPVGDLERTSMPSFFRAYNRGKYSIALDLKNPAELGRLHALARECDVFVEGFRPGAVERLGVAYADLIKDNPKLIYVSLNGYGTGGPRRDDRGHDPEYQALSGALNFNRAADGTPVYNSAGPFFDYAAAMYAIIGVLSALARPKRIATHVEVPIFAAGLAWVFPRLVDALESEHDIGTSQPVYRCGDGRYLTAAAVEENTWPPLCRALDRPDLLAREDLSTWAGRLARIDEMTAIMKAAMASRPRDEWIERLLKEGVPAAPILEAHEVLDEGQVRWLDIIRKEPTMNARLPINGIGSLRLTGAPALDEHGAQVRQSGWAGIGNVR